MKRTKYLSIFLLPLAMAVGCSNDDNTFDASGAFEADETIISAEVSGTILELNVEEGAQLSAGKTIGYIDSTQLYLHKKQLEAQIKSLLSKKPNIATQLASLQEQLATAEVEERRVANLVKSDAATTKQLDDIRAQVEIIKKQIEAQRSSLSISTTGITNDANVIAYQIEQLEDNLKKCRLINPIAGTVLTKYAEEHEVIAPGKPLYKIADLTSIFMRAYISGDQLPQVKLDQQVTVLTDDGKGGYNEQKGSITWISDKAEFTPKTIQTKNERANMVYAIKIKVANDGRYKIGMYGEVRF